MVSKPCVGALCALFGLVLIHATLAQEKTNPEIDKLIKDIFNLGGSTKPSEDTHLPLTSDTPITSAPSSSSDHDVYDNSGKDGVTRHPSNELDDANSNPEYSEPLFNVSKPVPGAETGQRVGDCTCVPYYLCKNDSTINTNGIGIIDIRIKENGKCKSYLDVCCKVPNDPSDPILPHPNPTTVGGGGHGDHGDHQDTGLPPIGGDHTGDQGGHTGGDQGGHTGGGQVGDHTTTKFGGGCGYRNAEGVGFRITGDKDGEAQFGEFPWMIAIINEEYLEGGQQPLKVYQCGGSLIHPKVVLTAAHCVSDKEKQRTLRVRAGEWDTQTKNEIFEHQEREIETIVIHKHYYSGALYNDVALLFLKEPINNAENVGVICLPPQGEVFDHQKCIASGWGKDVFGQAGRYQVILKKVTLEVVPHAACQDKLRHTRLGEYFVLHDSFICAGGKEGKDTCKGDGGSPLICPIKGAPGYYHQAGIVAWGIGCGEKDVPGVYVNIGEFRNWIEEQMTHHRITEIDYNYNSNNGGRYVPYYN